jgi:hypothetical protein
MFTDKSVCISYMVMRTAYVTKFIILYFIALILKNESFQRVRPNSLLPLYQTIFFSLCGLFKFVLSRLLFFLFNNKLIFYPNHHNCATFLHKAFAMDSPIT